jgi:hypothetical protein
VIFSLKTNHLATLLADEREGVRKQGNKNQPQNISFLINLSQIDAIKTYYN